MDLVATADRLGQMYFMAGQIGTSPAPPPSSGYFSGWQGKPPFDARAVMQWTGDLYDHYVVFFKGDAQTPYAVFLRPNPVNPGGGLIVTVTWGLPYFRNHLPRLKDGRRFPDYLPVDLQASRRLGRRVPAIVDTVRFASDPGATVLESNDVVVVLPSIGGLQFLAGAGSPETF